LYRLFPIPLIFMKLQNSSDPLVKLPFKAQVALYLIKEELKSRRVFNALHAAGFGECAFQPRLDSLILKTLGLYDGKDETFALYDSILEKRCRKIKPGNDSVTRQAFKAYQELKSKKKKRSAKNK